MPVRSKQTIVRAIALRSFTGSVGRMRRGQVFECTLAVLEDLQKIGHARYHSETTSVEGPAEVKKAPDDNKKADDDGKKEADDDKKADSGEDKKKESKPKSAKKKSSKKRGKK